MIKFSINNWALWDLAENIQFADYPACFSGKTELNGLKPMVKRRMPPMAKAIKQLDTELDLAAMPTVFASKHGELSRTMKIIRQYGGDLSPALFSMSVHNAIAGLLSVINQDNSIYTVIDSMSGVLEMAVVEAVGLLAQHPSVKVVYFEEQTPEELLSVNPHPDLGLVMIMVIEAGDQLSLSLSSSADQVQQSNVSNDQITALLDFLAGKKNSLTSPHARQTWQWQHVK